jgi:hypothetical protein
MKKVIKLTEADLMRIVKRVVKEDVDQLDNLVDEAHDILNVMYDFCERAQMIWDVEIPEEDSVETDDLANKVGDIETLCYKFKEILRDY